MKEMALCSTIDLTDPVIKSRQAVLVDLSVMFFLGGLFALTQCLTSLNGMNSYGLEMRRANLNIFVFGICFMVIDGRWIVPSPNLTKHLKMDGWKTIVSLWGPAFVRLCSFQGG